MKILLSDFRTVKNGEVINFNIGTAAHAPGTLAVLRKHLPEARVAVWAEAPLSAPLAGLMARHFPEVPVVSGHPDGPDAPELARAVAEADLFLVSSGSTVAGPVRRNMDEFLRRTGKPAGAYAIGFHPDTLPWLDRMRFAWFRDPVSTAEAAARSRCPLQGWAPDAVFDFDCTDTAGAVRFMAENGLAPGAFICCIPGQRHTPRWEYFDVPFRPERAAENARHEERDNAPLIPLIGEAVRRFGLKVLICAEQISELPLIRRLIFDRLPPNVRAACVPQEAWWPPDLALGVYRASRGVFGVEMHSQVMAVGNGVPGVVLRHPQFGSKCEMWKSIGLADWLLDADSPDSISGAAAVLRDILTHPDRTAEKLRNARRIIDRAAAEAVRRSFPVRSGS